LPRNPEMKPATGSPQVSKPSKSCPREVMMQARIHPHWIGGRSGYAWSVLYDGELLVSRSTTPEFDAARALLAKGITGKLTLLDGKTGRPRLTLDIERCDKLTVREDRHRGPCFVQWKPMPSDAQERDEGEPSTGEEAA
jgi:hypothetical protein